VCSVVHKGAFQLHGFFGSHKPVKVSVRYLVLFAKSFNSYLKLFSLNTHLFSPIISMDIYYRKLMNGEKSRVYISHHDISRHIKSYHIISYHIIYVYGGWHGLKGINVFF
jgi:hypothetical protein